MTGLPITAYAVCNGLGLTTSDVLEGLFAGRRGLSEARAWLGVETWVGALPEELPPLRRELARFESRQARVAALVTELILPGVSAAVGRWGADRVALVLGTSTAGIGASEDAWTHHRDHNELPQGFALERQHALYATAELVRAMTGVRGPGYVVSTACSSSGKVFASAQRLIRAGIADAVVVGGIDSLCRLTVRGFASLEVLSAEPCRPFSANRRGINIGEGGALLVVERPRRGVDVAVHLLGVGESSDAHHMTTPHPQGAGARLAMARAIESAGLTPAEIDQVNVHGTGTIKNDETESKALRDLFAEDPEAELGGPQERSCGSSLAVVATKGYTGHMLGAAGATEAVFSIASIERGVIPGSVGSDPIDEALGVVFETEPRARATQNVLSNSLAFGGSNVSVLVGAAR